MKDIKNKDEGWVDVKGTEEDLEEKKEATLWKKKSGSKRNSQESVFQVVRIKMREELVNLASVLDELKDILIHKFEPIIDTDVRENHLIGKVGFTIGDIFDREIYNKIIKEEKCRRWKL